MAKTLIANVVMDVLGSLDRVGYGPIFGNADAVPTDVAARISNPAAWALSATSEAAMLGLSATVGDVCIRTDLDPDGVFILTSSPASTLGNWTHLNPLPELSLGGVDIATQAELEAALAAKQDSIPPGTFVDVPEGTPEVGQVPVVTDDSPLTFGWGDGGGGDFAAGGASATDAQLKAWTSAEAYELTAITRDADEVPTTATVKWPDGSAGTFTTVTKNATWLTIDAYTISHTQSGKTVTQAAVTRDAGGAVTVKPALTVA